MNPFDEATLARIFTPHPKNPSLIKTREGNSIEYKSTFESKKLWKYLKTVAAFANHDGGYLIFGIKDRPHEMLGLEGKSLRGFESFDPAALSDQINKFFEPTIQVEKHTYELGGKEFGLLYVFQNRIKPVICKADKMGEEDKIELMEGIVYYRYGASSRPVKYPELQAMIREEQDRANGRWIAALSMLASSSPDKIAMLDLDSRALMAGNAKLYMDEELVKGLSFVKEGSFVETGGDPALIVKGTVETIGGTKPLLIPEEVPTTINEGTILESFLLRKQVQSPDLYLLQICALAVSSLPIFYYMALAHTSEEEAIQLVSSVEKETPSKKSLLTRLRGERKASWSRNHTSSKSGQLREQYYEDILANNVSLPNEPEKVKDFFGAVRLLSIREISDHQEALFSLMFKAFKQYYLDERYKDSMSEMRQAICWLDEALYKPER